MTIDEVYEYYGKSWRIAMQELGMGRFTYHYWQKVGGIPLNTQKRIAMTMALKHETKKPLEVDYVD